jgi:SAM-dependent methyltransferase
MKTLVRKIKTVIRFFNWREIRIQKTECSLCGTTVLLRLRDAPVATKCLSCGANIFVMSLVAALKEAVPNLDQQSIYELSSQGPLFDYLKKYAKKLTYSEYFDDIPPGTYKDDIQCQDVQQLTFMNDAFNICTSTEVFEHVADDDRGFSEIYRVLKSGGIFLFTVPFTESDETEVRARVVNGKIEHLMPPEYHDDLLRGTRQVLCFRKYGTDIVEKLTDIGFKKVWIERIDSNLWWGYGRPVIVAQK